MGIFKILEISTHTLTWSVTAVIQTVGENIRISTHTLTWSVTRKMLLTWVSRFWISTHTLTWSVTLRFSTLALYHANFNSHAHVERDTIRVTI